LQVRETLLPWLYSDCNLRVKIFRLNWEELSSCDIGNASGNSLKRQKNEVYMNNEARVELSEKLGFNFEDARKIVLAYSRSTGSNCLIVEKDGTTVFESNDNCCKYCKLFQLNQFNCSDVLRYGCYQAERFGGRYIFFCPLGLTHWASPITVNDTIHGALIGGPVLMVDPEEFMLGDLIESGTVYSTKKEDLNEFVSKIPVRSTENVNDLAELLFSVASQISNVGNSKQKEQTKYNKVQAEISETVHGIKRSVVFGDQIVDYPFAKEHELLTAISLGDKPASQKILNEILGYVFFSSGRDIEVVRARTQELAVLLSRAAIEGGADSTEIFGLNYQYLSEISKFKTVEELAFWLSKILARFTDCVFNLVNVKHKDIIYKAIDYIKKNYMKKITLQEVADCVYLNPSYFSKIFKSELNCSFVNYVNKIRVEMSKNLLFDLSIPITDVSSLVGFDEQCYFTKVFKKITGMPPGLFRKTMGRKEPENS
jgi:two-component system response regulator YesN